MAGFDTRTLGLVLVLAALLEMVMMITQRAYQKRYPGTLAWLLGTVAIAVGTSLNILRDVPTIGAAATIGNNIAFGAGTVLFQIALARFFGLRTFRGLLFGLLAVQVAIASWFVLVVDEPGIRRANFSFFVAIFCAFNIATLLRGSRRMPLRDTLALIFSFGLAGSFSLFRAYSVLTHLPSGQVNAEDPVQFLTYLVFILTTALWTFGFSFMVTERLSMEREAELNERIRAEARVRELLKEKELILKEAHHRIKNNMNAVASLLSLQADRVSSGEGATALEDAADRVGVMMVLYDRLYRSEDTRSMSISDYLSSLLEGILEAYPTRQRLSVERRIEEFSLDAGRLSQVGIIVNELFSNIRKYAFPGREEGSIIVAATLEDGWVTIRVEDDGVGPGEYVRFDGAETFGFSLIALLAEQLRGSAELDRSVPGTRVIVRFPWARNA